jgi:ABC-type sulfate/molybdate transport systems ATPase subunit
VAFGLEVAALGRAEIQAKGAKILDVVQMGHLGARHPQELSDQTVRPAENALALRVTARPHEVFELDPRRMAALEPE